MSIKELVDTLVAEIGKVLLGKDEQIKLSLACLFSRGHLLIEDLPGMGKTTLAHALAKVFGLSYNRIQFTSDLLPADILGMSIFNKNSGEFTFIKGPVFSQLLLADEINRSTPKTQSALLEAMEEGQVSIEGQTRPLPQPFFVIATQNPLSQSGTFPLPESQLDRFLMRVELGYPDPKAERALYLGGDSRQLLSSLRQRINAAQLDKIVTAAKAIKVSDPVLDYFQRLMLFTRQENEFSIGVSPRGALALLHCAKTWALMQGRDYLIPEDIQHVMPTVVGHRLADRAGSGEHRGEALVQRVLNSVDVLPS